jgi:hypothetical protein
MTSQTDLDQGGTNRQWQKTYLGPTIGWISAPFQNFFPISAVGTYFIDFSTTLVAVNVVGAVTINLPKATNPAGRGAAGAQPGLFADNPITIVDIGGNAFAHPITILPASGENVLGLASITLGTNYGGYTLLPNSSQQGWTSISP